MSEIDRSEHYKETTRKLRDTVRRAESLGDEASKDAAYLRLWEHLERNGIDPHSVEDIDDDRQLGLER